MQIFSRQGSVHYVFSFSNFLFTEMRLDQNMKILTLGVLLLGLSLTESAAVIKNLQHKSKDNSSKLENNSNLEIRPEVEISHSLKLENSLDNNDTSVKIDKSKRAISKAIASEMKDETNFKQEVSDSEQVERVKKSCQVISTQPNTPARICMEITGPKSEVKICDNNYDPYSSRPSGVIGQNQDNSLPSNYYGSSYDPSYFGSGIPYFGLPSQSADLSSPYYASGSAYSVSSPNIGSSYPYNDPSLSLTDPSSVPSYNLPSSNPLMYVINPNQQQSPLTSFSINPQQISDNGLQFPTSPNQQGLQFQLSNNPSQPEYTYPNYGSFNPYGSSGTPYGNYQNNGYPNQGSNSPGTAYSLVRQCTCKITPVSTQNLQSSVKLPMAARSSEVVQDPSSFSLTSDTNSPSARTIASLQLPAVANPQSHTSVILQPAATINSPSSSAFNNPTFARSSPSVTTYRLVSPATNNDANHLARASINLGNPGIGASLESTVPRISSSSGISLGLAGREVSSPFNISPGLSNSGISTSPGIALNNFGSGVVQGARYYRKLDEVSADEEPQETTTANKNQQKRSQQRSPVSEKLKKNDQLLKTYHNQKL